MYMYVKQQASAATAALTIEVVETRTIPLVYSTCKLGGWISDEVL